MISFFSNSTSAIENSRKITTKKKTNVLCFLHVRYSIFFYLFVLVLYQNTLILLFIGTLDVILRQPLDIGLHHPLEHITFNKNVSVLFVQHLIWKMGLLYELNSNLFLLSVFPSGSRNTVNVFILTVFLFPLFSVNR